jgi:hypothetical protein
VPPPRQLWTEGDDDEVSRGRGWEWSRPGGQIKILLLIDVRITRGGLELRLVSIFVMLADDSQNEEQDEKQEDEDEGFSSG